MTSFIVDIPEELIGVLAHRFNDERLSPAEMLQLLALQASSQDGIMLQSAWRWMRINEITQEGDEQLVGENWKPSPPEIRVFYANTYRRRLL